MRKKTLTISRLLRLHYCHKRAQPTMITLHGLY